MSRRELDSFLSQRRSQSAVPAGTKDLAAAYVDWLSHSTGKKYRLPTEVELEYACIADGTMPAWVQTDNRAAPDASADVAELNAWGFMDLPDAATELTSDASQSPQGAWWHSDRMGSVFRVVRVPEGNQPAANANSNSAGANAVSSARATAVGCAGKELRRMKNSRDRELGMDRPITRRDFLIASRSAWAVLRPVPY